MKKIRRMLSALVLTSMLMNVPAPVFAESAGEAPAAVGQQAEAPKQDANDRCLCRKRKKAGVWLNLYRRMSGNVPWYSVFFLNFGRKYGNKKIQKYGRNEAQITRRGLQRKQ